MRSSYDDLAPERTPAAFAVDGAVVALDQLRRVIPGI